MSRTGRTEPALRLHRQDPAENIARFYHLALMPNLFGEWSLHRQWGRIGTAGRTRVDLYETVGEAKRAMGGIEVAKRKRGYR